MPATSQMPRSATGYTSALVKTMFVVTADQNYTLARWAFLNALNVDFFWLGLHAVEKYLKAVLLYNGRSAKGYGHDIVKLHKAVLRLDARLSFGPFERPAAVPQDLPWTNDTVESFIERMNEMGDPNNRYMLYGWVQRPDDLVKLDRLVWAVRRHCRPFTVTLRMDAKHTKTIDWVCDLKKRTTYWRLDGTLLIEKAAAGRTPDAVRDALFTLNYAFAPDADHQLDRWRSAAANPPLAAWFERLRAVQASADTKQTARETLEWVLDNVPLNKSDKATLKDALAEKEMP